MDKVAAIRLFLRVAKSGSFAKAAEQAGISTTSASRGIRELENSVRTRLLNRSTRSLSLTEAGERLFTFYDQVIGELDAIETEVADSMRGESATGRVRAALPHTFSTKKLQAAIYRFREAHPQIELEIRLDDAPTDLIRDGFDIAIRIAPSLDLSRVARRLSTIQTFLCASPDYVREHGEPANPTDLINHECLIYSDNPVPESWEFKREDEYLEQRVSGSTKANNGELLTAFAVAGLGITLQPAFLVEDHLKSGKLVRVLETYEPRPRVVFAVYPSRRYIPTMVRIFTDFIAAELDR